MMPRVAFDLERFLSQDKIETEVLPSLKGEIFKGNRKLDDLVKCDRGIAADLLKRLRRGRPQDEMIEAGREWEGDLAMRVLGPYVTLNRRLRRRRRWQYIEP